jgi:hypothetical protein
VFLFPGCPKNILVQVVINHLHNPGKGLQLRYGSPAGARNYTARQRGLVPNAFGVVVSGDYVFVAYSELRLEYLKP